MLLDAKPTNYMMTPENAIPVQNYTAEVLYTGDEEEGSKDPYLLELIDEIDEIKELEDIRPVL